MDAPVENARARANAAQRAASDPAVSAFVSASAGSGKTKLLTDRLLRLMLGGADPARIQCLTYTRAAAAEMALRLQSVLGQWVTLGDTALDERLRALDIAPDAATRERARALFARVLDLPGGMRIGTIHAFCQSLLRRFPLEANISPHFRLIEDAEADAARQDAAASVLGDRPERPDIVDQRRAALDRIAGLADLRQFDKLVRETIEDRERLAALLARTPEDIAGHLRLVLGAPDAGAVEAEMAAWTGQDALRATMQDIAGHSDTSPGIRRDMLAQLDWLALPERERRARWPEWLAHFVTKGGAPCAASTLLNNKLAQQRPDLLAPLLAEQARLCRLLDGRRALVLLDACQALLHLVLPVARAYASGKQAAIRLDYADLIDRTMALLRDPGAAWVLFKLDGGLDHLLLDEVQDTAPAQWDIAGAILAEFFAGEGARDVARTVFAVGDRKQSIFSFQGADPGAFDGWRDRLRAQVRDAGAAWRDVSLDVSFRSTEPVLRLVDAVFADPVAADGVGPVAHQSDRAGQAGCVELWPLVPVEAKQDVPPWQVPGERIAASSAPQRLAESLADWVRHETAGRVMLPSRGRALAPGDVLILVRRRNEFSRALVRALKRRGVPVAGLDRMVLTEQPAVADLLALCDALLLPQDDLQLACVLTSPLGGLSDDSLMALAAERPERQHLWDALRRRAEERPDWREAHAMLSRLFARVDYATPHALLAEALGAGGGRARLLARLGEEAAEPIDELLAAALIYQRGEPPSLQGFLHWLRRSAAEIKREAHAEGGGLVRIMTVHGAKGLQAPLVVLPDTTAMPKDDGTLLCARPPGGTFAVPVWSPVKDLRCAAVEALRREALARELREYNRLLYVALTRAEDRLVVCGYEPRKAPPDGCWYRLVERGFAVLGDAAEILEGGIRRHACAQCDAPDRAGGAAWPAAMAPLPDWAGHAPDWAGRAPPAEPALPQRLAPSRPAEAALGPVPASASPLARAGGRAARFRRGTILHALLQHLPDLPPAERAAAAERFVSRPGSGLAPEEVAPALADVLAVLGDPALAPLFGPESRAEVPLTGRIGDFVVGGLVDRLAVLPDRVLVADYKTARVPPARPEAVPVLYLRQMAAYRAVLRAAFPGRRVECLLIWTTGARVMPLPQALLDSHAPAAAPR